MPSRSRLFLLPITFALLLAGCAAPARKPAPAATPAPALAPTRAPAGNERNEQTAQPPAPPAGQAAPSSANQQFRAAGKAPSSLSGGEKKTKALAFKSVSDAEAALARANKQLVALYTPADTVGARGGAASQPAQANQRTTTATADKESRCATACKAFASLKRAADAVCRLAGDDDARCDHARKLVEKNGRRVAECGCRDDE